MQDGADIPDEVLMAFADGQLDGEEAARVERAVNASPELEAKVALFMASRDRARGAFARVLTEPVPERLLQAAMGRSSVQAQAGQLQGQLQGQSAGRNAGASARPARGWVPLALAASVAAVAAGLAGYLGGRAGDAPTNAAAALFTGAGAIASALDGLGDGESRALAASRLTVAATYRMGDQRVCRAVDLAHGPSGTAAQGLACRAGDGWRIEVAIPKQPDDGQFRPAGAAPGLEALLDAGGASQPLTRADSDRLMRQGWR